MLSSHIQIDDRKEGEPDHEEFEPGIEASLSPPVEHSDGEEEDRGEGQEDFVAELSRSRSALSAIDRSLRCPFFHKIFHTPVILSGINQTVEEEAARKLISGELSYNPYVRITHYSFNSLVANQVESYLQHFPAAASEQYVPALPCEFKDEHYEPKINVRPVGEILLPLIETLNKLQNDKEVQSNKQIIETALVNLRNERRLVEALNYCDPKTLIPFAYSLICSSQSGPILCALPGIEQISTENLNYIVPNGNNAGETFLAWLTYHSEGRGILRKYPSLRTKISAEAFNSSRAHGYDSALYYLCFKDLDLLHEDTLLQTKISIENLNFIINSRYRPKSIIYILCRSVKGREILCQNPHLRDSIRVNTFYDEAPFSDNLEKTTSPALEILLSEKCLELFRSNPLLLEAKNIQIPFLEKLIHTGPFFGKCVAEWFLTSNEGKQLLENNAALRSKIISYVKGRLAEGVSYALDIFYSSPELQAEITTTELNNIRHDGNSLLGVLACSPKGRDIICRNPHLRDGINITSFYHKTNNRIPFINLLLLEKSVELFQHNPQLLDAQYIQTSLLQEKIKSAEPYKGKSIAYWFLNSERGKALLENNAALRSKVLSVYLLEHLVNTKWKWGLFRLNYKPRNIEKQIKILENQIDAAGIEQVREIGKQAATKFSFFRARETQEFYDICADDNKFKAKFGGI